MQTRPFLIIPACVSECSRNRGGGLETSENKPTIKMSNNRYFCCCFFLSPAPFSHILLLSLSHCASEPQSASEYVVSSPMQPPTPWRTIVCGPARKVSLRTILRCGICCRRRRTGSVGDWSSLHRRWSILHLKWKIYSHTSLQEQSLQRAEASHFTYTPRPCIPFNNILIVGGVVSPFYMDVCIWMLCACYIRWPLFVLGGVLKRMFLTFFFPFVLTTGSRAWV